MEVQQAVLAYSLSDKIKSAIISANSAFEILAGLSEMEKRGAEAIIRFQLATISHEVRIAENIAGESESWHKASEYIDRAMLMMNSGVPQDSPFHLSKALSHVTDIALHAMTFLRERGMI